MDMTLDQIGKQILDSIRALTPAQRMEWDRDSFNRAMKLMKTPVGKLKT
jgi:hypothetical protein